MELVRLNKDNVLTGNNTHEGNNLFSGYTIFDEALKTGKNVGVVTSGSIEVLEYGDGIHHMTKLVLTDFIVAPLAGAAAAKALVPVLPIYTFPSGYQIITACRAKIGLTAVGTAVTPEIGLGSVIGNGSANATIGAAGATQEDYLEGFAVATTVSHAQVDSGIKTATAGVLTGIALNDPNDAKNVYLNCAGTWNADNTGFLIANGEVLIVWTCLP